MKILFLLLILVNGVSISMEAQQERNIKLVSVIFDTDIGGDIDDVLALQMLYNYHKQGKINLLGITLSKPNPRLIEFVDGLNRFNNLENIPLGFVYKGAVQKISRYATVPLDTIIEGKNILFPKLSIKDSLPPGYKLIRKLLVSQPDKSVVIIVVGGQTNLANLIESVSDQYSRLNGIELVNKKVKFLSLMGGNFTTETFNNPECNMILDLNATKIVFDKWPTEIVSSPSEVGSKILYPSKSFIDNLPEYHKHPIYVAYCQYDKMPYDRPSWDLTSVLYAVEPNANYFDISPNGWIKVDKIGKTSFTFDKKGKHRILYVNNPEQIKRVKTECVLLVTGKKWEEK